MCDSENGFSYMENYLHQFISAFSLYTRTAIILCFGAEFTDAYIYLVKKFSVGAWGLGQLLIKSLLETWHWAKVMEVVKPNLPHHLFATR